MSKRNYYEVLGVARTASQQEIKSAYRKMAVRLHPDRNPGDKAAEESFKEAAEAYSVLSDPEKRARFDRFGHRGVTGGGFGGFDPTVFGDFADILGDFFGFGFSGTRRPRTGQPGADLRYELHITLQEAAFGTEKTLRIPRLERCETCGGSGAAAGSSPETCPHCRGLGQVQYSQGFFTVARPCERCGGEGQVVSDPCVDCDGDGRIERERELEVKVPAGVDTGARLRLRAEGEHGRRGGPDGDLYVDLVLEPHPTFERQGRHVVSRVEISYSQAVLGTTVEVETLHGAVTLDVPPGTEHGAQFRLPRKGMPSLTERGLGDHVVVAGIRVPEPSKLDQERLDLLKRLAELEGETVGDGRGVLGRVRDLFG